MSGDEKVAYHDVLEADENGHTPDSPAYNVKSQSSTELIGKHELAWGPPTIGLSRVMFFDYFSLYLTQPNV